MINHHEVYENINCNMGVMYNFIFNNSSGNIFYSTVLCNEYSLPLIVIVIEMEDFSTSTFSMASQELKQALQRRKNKLYIHGS